MKEKLKLVTEIDFITFGVKPRGEIFLRASQILLDSVKLKAKLYQKENLLLEITFSLVKSYVELQEIRFNPNENNQDDWLTNKQVEFFMNGLYQIALQKTVKFRDKIEDAANDSELYAVALGIIHEYESFYLHKVKIAKYVKSQRKKIESTREMLLYCLEKLYGLICKGCGSVENLQIDHIKPLSLGGSSTLDNLQLLCSFCNKSKGNRPMAYLARRQNKLKTL